MDANTKTKTPAEIAAEQHLAFVGGERNGYGLKDLDDGISVWWPAEPTTNTTRLLRAYFRGDGRWHS